MSIISLNKASIFYEWNFAQCYIKGLNETYNPSCLNWNVTYFNSFENKYKDSQILCFGHLGEGTENYYSINSTRDCYYTKYLDLSWDRSNHDWKFFAIFALCMIPLIIISFLLLLYLLYKK